MGRGHGGTGRSTWRGSVEKGIGDESMVGLSPQLMKVLKEREDLIRLNDAFEMGTVYDEKGNVIFTNNRGNAGSVYLGDNTENMIVTHNHPGEMKNGKIEQALSLSDEDMFIAARYNEREIRAVTRNYTYSLRRPKGGWGIDSTNHGYVKDSSGNWVDNADVQRMKRVYRESFAHVSSKIYAYADSYKGGSEAAWNRAMKVLQHQVNREFARRMGWEYTKTRVDNATLLKFGGKPWRST